jgi:hypothetical protein
MLTKSVYPVGFACGKPLLKTLWILWKSYGFPQVFRVSPILSLGKNVYFFA